jgi:hypothetical protein
MKNTNLLLLLLMTLFCLTSYGQTKVLKGKVIISEPSYEKGVDSEFLLAPESFVFSTDTTKLGVTNKEGIFEIEVPINTSRIFVSWIAYDWEQIELSDSCDFIEVVLIPSVIYDFVSVRKAYKLNEKHRKKWLPELYRQAFEQGFIRSEKPCR